MQQIHGDETNQIIAECIFERYGSSRANRLMIGSRENAKRAILEFTGRADHVTGQENDRVGTVQHIFNVIDNALAMAGYKILDGDRDSVIIRYSRLDADFEIKISEIAP